MLDTIEHHISIVGWSRDVRLSLSNITSVQWGGPEMLDTIEHHISIVGWSRDVRLSLSDITSVQWGGPEMLDMVKHHISTVGWSRDVRHGQTSHQYNGEFQTCWTLSNITSV